jgi:hypothetical protein
VPKPDWRYLVLDETRNWLVPELIEKCGRIFGIYIFDITLGVHICDMSPSYELYFLRSEPQRTPDDDREREEVLDQIMDGDRGTDPVTYIYCHNVRNAEQCMKVGFTPEPDDTRDSREQADDVLAYAVEAYQSIPLPD